ncbi:hydrolase [Photobacterium sanctipauli]|uniref:Hydrolase n=1 Tax=Photobacterium sanctipauli TaxID=1342794 RepID=A0A2T3NSE8_9GAMM|nr:hydrolase [Photobacterium sanctipauli]PSW19213.1 hydrolase [Photobacterium sanctipauli]
MTPFEPASGLANAHVQTLLPRFLRRNPLFEPLTQRIETPDGDFLDLAWTASPETCTDAQPVMILFHGLEGSFHSPYAHGLLHAAHQQGWLGVMMHFRGCSGEINRQPRSYHSGETQDARYFIEWLRQRLPTQPLFAVGVSLGGNMLVNYLAEHQHDSHLTAAQVISPPLDLASCSSRIQQGFSKVYQQYLLGSMKRNLGKKIQALPEAMPLKHDQAEKIRTLWQFDEQVTAPLHGFDNADDYYRRCSGLGKLAKVSIPLRVIHAKDDPFMTDAVIPSEPLPEHIDYDLCHKGGHVGFVSGSWRKPDFWLDRTVPEWFGKFVDSGIC